MKLWMIAVSCGVALSLPMLAQARETELTLSIEQAMSSPDAQAKLGEEIKYYFGNQKAPKAAKNFGEASTHKKTNAFNKSDEEACQWAFLSAMVALRDRAVREGANAVTHIRSYYGPTELNSSTEYKCNAGNIMAGVHLKGTFISTK